MTNFYKGGRELPNGKDSSCSPEIKSKKIRVQLPELLASFQLYFTRIFQVRVKHYLSTDIALFTQLLRKQIYKGKMYYKGTCPVLQKRLQSSDQKITKPKSTRRGAERPLSSDNFRINFALTSAFQAEGHKPPSNFPLIFPEGDPKPTRRNSEQRREKGRSWSGAGRSLNGLFLGTKGTVNSPLSYWVCTERVPKRYWECTKELLEIYQRGTKLVRAVSSWLAGLGCKLCNVLEKCAKGAKTYSTIGASEYSLKLKSFKAVCAFCRCEDVCFIIEKKLSAQKALKCFISLCCYKNTYRLFLTCVFLVLVSMFSLSAQTPCRNSGADGSLTNAKTSQVVVLPAVIELVKNTAGIKPLQVGDKVPEAFWNAEHSFLAGNRAVKLTLSKFRGKLLLLDFWEPYCYACLLKFPALDSLQSQLGKLGNIVLVGSKQYRRGTAAYISQKLDEQRQRQQITLGMDKIIQDDILKDYFAHFYIPHYILISGDGTVLALGSVEVFDTIAQIIKDEVHNNKNQRR